MIKTTNSFKEPQRIGLFGGTFDPIHIGHLILARDALEALQLDRVLFLPAQISPHKQHMPPVVSREHRLTMLQLALQGEPHFELDDRDIKRDGPSFAIDTVRELQQEYSKATFIYLIGEDHVATLSTWKESEELQKRVAFALMRRMNLQSQVPDRFLCLPRTIEISSTEIRERLAKGLSVRYFVPSAVLTYLEKNSLYANSR